MAAVKLLAVLESSTSALLASTVHSLIDASSLALLFLGLWNASAAADSPPDRAPDRALYFWSFVVAILLYAMGGGIALYEGVERLARPQPLIAPPTDMLVLAAAAAGAALMALVAMRELRSSKVSTDPLQIAVDRPDLAPVIAVLAIATAAIAGNVLALGGLLGAANGGDQRSDPLAAIAVGLAMSAVAAFMAIEVKRLLLAGPVAGSGVVARRSIAGPPPSETPLQASLVNIAEVHSVLEANSLPASEASSAGAALAGKAPKPAVTARVAGPKGRGKRRR